MKLNLGCGKEILEGYNNYDREIDLEKKLPFEDNSVDEILCHHVLEHLINPEFTVSEFYRILKPNGVLSIKLPINCSMIRHKRFHHNRMYLHALYKSGGNFELLKFKKNKNKYGSVLGDVKNRLLTWIDNLFFNEYEWRLKKK